MLALRAFVRIAEAGSFAKAADAMNMPRSTASKLLQDLEAHLGTKLVVRTTRAVTMTDDGAAYYERALRVLADVGDMDAAVSSARSAPKGRLRIDIGSVLANLILIPALPDFQEEYPDIELQLGIGDRPVDLVGEGVDAVIRAGDLADTSMIAPALRTRLGDVRIAGPFSTLETYWRIPESLKRSIRSSATSPQRAVARRRCDIVRTTSRSNSLDDRAFRSTKAPPTSTRCSLVWAWDRPSGSWSGRIRKRVVLWNCFPTGSRGTMCSTSSTRQSRFPSQKLRVFSDCVAGVFSAFDMR